MTSVAPRRDEPIVDASGKITQRFAQFLEGINRLVTDDSTAVPDEINNSVSFTLQTQIGSGDPLTSDETGFTVDSTALSVDMTES
jgi:hypothetical protein